MILILIALISIPREHLIPDPEHFNFYIEIDELILVSEMEGCVITYKHKGRFNEYWGRIEKQKLSYITVGNPKFPKWKMYFKCKKVVMFKTRKEYQDYRRIKFFGE